MSNYLLLILILLLAYCCPVSGMNKLDSLLNVELSPPSNEIDSARYNRKSQILNAYIRVGEFNQAKAYFSETEALAILLGLKQEAAYYTSLVAYYGMQNDLDSASIMLAKGMNINKKNSDDESLASNYFQMGTISMMRNNLDSAGFYLFKALDYYEERNMKKSQLRVLTNLNGLFTRVGDLDKAAMYSKQCIPLSKLLKDTNSLAMAYTNYAVTLKSIEPVNFDTILAYQYEALKLYELSANILGIARENSNIGSILWKMGDFEKAPPYLKKAEKMYTEMGKERLLKKVYLSLGSYHFKLKEYQRSKEYYEKALPLCKLSDDPIMLSHNYLCLARVDQKFNKLNSAIKNYEAVQTLSDSIIIYQNRKLVLGLEKKYQNRVKTDSINILKLQNDNHLIGIAKRNNGLMFGGVIIFLLGAFASVYKKNYQNEKKLTEILGREKEELIFEKNDLVKLNALIIPPKKGQ